MKNSFWSSFWWPLMTGFTVLNFTLATSSSCVVSLTDIGVSHLAAKEVKAPHWSRISYRQWATCKQNVQLFILRKCIGPEVIQLFSCSTQLSTRLILLINVKMPTIIGILTFISMINATSESKKLLYLSVFKFL